MQPTTTGNIEALCSVCPIREIAPIDAQQFAAECATKYAYYCRRRIMMAHTARAVVEQTLESDVQRESTRAPITDCIDRQEWGNTADGQPCFNSQERAIIDT